MSNKYRIIWHAANYMNIPTTIGTICKPNFTTDIQVQKEVGELPWEYFQQVEMKSHILHIATRKYISGEHMWQGASNTAVKVGTVLYISITPGMKANFIVKPPAITFTCLPLTNNTSDEHTIPLQFPSPFPPLSPFTPGGFPKIHPQAHYSGVIRLGTHLKQNVLLEFNSFQ